MTHSTTHTLSANQDSATLAMPIAEPAPVAGAPRPSVAGTSTSWTSTSGGDFTTAANWSNGLVPGTGIDATIETPSTDPFTVTLSAANATADSLITAFAGLSMTNATLTLQGAINGQGSAISTGAATALTQTGGLLDFQNGASQNDTSAISSGGAAIIQNAGTIEVDAGTLTIAGNSSFAGTLTGSLGEPDSGDVQLGGNATYNFQAGAAISVGEVSIVGTSSMILDESLTYNGNFVENAGTLAIGAHVFTLDDTAGTLSTLNGLVSGTQFTNQALLRVDGATLSSGTTLSNSGTLLFSQGGGLTLGNGGTAVALLTNTGTIALQNGNINVLGGSLTNAGVLQIGTNADLATNINNPTGITNSGTISVASGDTVAINSPFSNTGTITGAGLFELAPSGADTLRAGTTISVGTFELNGGNSSLTVSSNISSLTSGTFSIFQAVTFDMIAKLSYGGIFDDEGNGGDATIGLGTLALTLSGTNNLEATNDGNDIFTGTGTVVLSGTTTVTGDGFEIGEGTNLLNSGHLSQAATVQLGDTNAIGAATNTGIWDVIGNAELGGSVYHGSTNPYSTFANSGTFEMTATGDTATIDDIFTNTGIVNTAAGAITDFVDTLANSGTLSGAGELEISGGTTTLGSTTVLSVGTLAVAGSGALILGDSLQYTGAFTEDSAAAAGLTLDGDTLTLSGTAIFGTTNITTVIDGPGTLALTGSHTSLATNSTVVLGDAASLINSGTLTQDGLLQIGDTAGSSASVTNSAGGTWTLALGNGIQRSPGVATTFTNAGVFQDTDLGTAIPISAGFDNSGTVKVSGTELDFSSTFVNTGTLTGAGTIALTSNAIGTLSTGTLINVAAFSVTQTATLDLTANIGYAGVFNDQGSNGTTVNLAGHTLTLSKLAAFGGAYSPASIDGPGTLSLTGTSTITSTGDGLDIGGTTALLNAGLMTQNGQLQIGDSSEASATVINAAKGTWAIATATSIIAGANGSSSFTNAGLFENTGSGETQTVGTVFANSGTIAVGSNDATDFTAGFSNTGTISGAGAFVLTGSAVGTFGAGAVISVAQIGLTGTATLDLGASLTYAGLFNDQGSNATTLNLASNTLSLTGQANFGGTYDDAHVAGSGTLSLSGTTTITGAGDGLELGGTTALVNSGTVTQAGSLQIGDSAANVATVINSATGIWQLGTSNTISTGGNASSSFSNAGLVENTGTGNTARIAAVFNTTGTLTDTSNGSTVALAGGGSIAGTLSGGGEIDFDNGGTYTLGTATVLSVAAIGINNASTDVTLTGAASYAGTLSESAGATLDLGTKAAKLTLTGVDSLDGSVTGSGTVLLGTGGVLIADNLTIGGAVMLQDSGGTIAEAQNISIGSNAASTASLSIAAGSTYEITGDVTIAGQGLGAITNAGVFEMAGGNATGTSTVDPLFTNTGTVMSTSGTLVFAGGFTNNKLVAVSNGHEVVFDGSVNATGTSAGTISLASGGMALFGGFVGSAETLSFADGSSSSATLSDATGFDGTISGFSGSNTLTLGDFTNATGSYSGGVLTLTGDSNGGTATVELHFAGSYTLASFTIENNGGNTVILDPKS